MEIIGLLKSAAEVGITVPMAIGLNIIWQINKKFNDFNVRITVLEAEQHNRRHTDKR